MFKRSVVPVLVTRYFCDFILQCMLGDVYKCGSHGHVDVSKLHHFRYFKTRANVFDRVFGADDECDNIFLLGL